MKPIFERKLRQAVAAAALCSVLMPCVPARAMSTAQEIAKGSQESQAIDKQSVLVHDPFLTSWVDRVGSQLAAHRSRRDINYTFTIIDDQSINAFAIKGGFVHVNEGLLNFVSSDDELAATLGHETGHVELHHVTKADNTNTVIGVLESIISLISIPGAILGSIAGEMASDKYSRKDELQADGYGLALMTAAGYDPQAAVSVMRKLETLDPGPGGRADKAFLDHPVPRDRVAHLMGYPPLDRPSAASLAARALHDASEGRYLYAHAALQALSRSTPGATPSVELQRLNYALHESGLLAAPDSRPGTAGIAPADPRRRAAAAALEQAESNRAAAQKTLKLSGPAGIAQLRNLQSRLNSSQAIAAQASESRPQPVRSGGGNRHPTDDPVVALNRDLNDIGNLTGDVFSSAGGLVDAERQPISDMLAPLGDAEPLTPKYAALMASYPAITRDFQSATAELIDAVVKSSTAIAAVDSGLDELNATYSVEANQSQGQSGASDPHHGSRIRAAMSRFAARVAAARTIAQAASTEMYAAQTVGLSAQLSMLDLLSSPERFEAYRQALGYRFPGVRPPAYGEAQTLGLPAGDLGCAAWLAFETAKPLSEVATSLRRTNRSCEMVAVDHGLSAESMEIAEGLLLEDYDEAPSALAQ